MLSKESVEKAWKNLPTNKQSVIATLDNASRNIVSEMRNNPQHTLQYYNALSLLLDKVVVEIASRNIFNAPEGWFYSFEVTNKNAALYLRHVSDIRDNDEGNVVFDIDAIVKSVFAASFAWLFTMSTNSSDNCVNVSL